MKKQTLDVTRKNGGQRLFVVIAEELDTSQKAAKSSINESQAFGVRAIK